MAAPTALVIGGSGFLGSHVVRQLVADGVPTRVMLRASSSTLGIDDLDVERCYGDVLDAEGLRAAMAGVADVYYCVVDTRAWLRDPAPLVRTNVEGLRVVLDVAATMPLNRFVFTSSLVTLAISPNRLVTEADPHNWVDRGGAYVASRLAAEQLLLSYVRDRGVPGIAMCVSNTYGSRDHLPTPHGQLVALAARGKLPFYFRGAGSDVVAIDDAARALVLAASKGRIGERYFVGERWM
ncbi:MAG TPA: NAD-dependent epimerase/dehydratase family protein, partial [Aeromicrobium sp.]|nr:NAD-dependent epimerase/dehydratase family protein [Aeromicrobium sp.]